ncbi:MAG: hypothetical protein KIT31_26680 [Deltaproteobacteria bacterium]|nr:hypothetical protein [Deltaproteobacteria bacterium]
MRQAFACVVAIVVLASGPRTAEAGRVFFGWLYGTEVMPERGVELQQWVYEKSNLGDSRIRESSIWWAPLIGVTDQLTIAIPVELEWLAQKGKETEYNFRRFGVEARYRLVTQDPEDKPAFAPLIRVGVKRDVEVRDVVLLEGDFVGSFDSGRLQLLVDLGVVGTVSRETAKIDLRPGVGFSVRMKGDFRLGAEAYGEVNLQEGGNKWFGVGPNFAWTQGRFWLSGAMLVGISNIKVAPRFMFGISF